MTVIPCQLYTANDVLGGFNPRDKMGYTLSQDSAIYREFAMNGGPLPATLAIRAAQAEHNAAIAEALRVFLKTSASAGRHYGRSRPGPFYPARQPCHPHLAVRG